MKTQIFTSLFLAVLFLSVVSVAAANYTLSSTSLKVNQPATTSSFAVTPTNSSVLSNYTITSGNFSLDDSSVVTVSGSSLTNINTTQTVNVSTSGLNYNKMSVGKTYSAILKVMDNNNEQQNVTASFERSFCDYGENGTWLEISDIEEDEDFEWNPLDDISIEVEVENNGKTREKITVELSLYSVADKEFVEFDGNDDVLEQSVRIEDDDSEVFTFDFKVSPELEEGDYKLYVKAYLDSDEAEACVARMGSKLYEDVTIDYDDEEAVIDNIEVPETTVCGFTERITMDVYNLDYGDDEDFRVNIYNQELGLDMDSDKFSLDNGDSRNVGFDFKIPANAAEKTYRIAARVDYDYRSSSETYREKTKDYFFPLKVENCKSASATISAELSEETPSAVIGSQVVVEATVKNTGTATATYNIEISGNTQWSKVAEIDPKSFSLNAGESKKVNIYLDVDSDAEAGDKEFTIKATYNGASVEQRVLVALEEGFNTSKLWNHLKAYWFLYVIGLITLILLIIVIVLLVRRS